MFSLIISVIAIVLVAVIAIATLYYGGNIFSGGGAAASAAQVLDESQQILNAVEAFKVDNASNMPTSMDDLLTGNYLNSAPASSWSFATDSVTATTLSENSCLKANAMLGYNLSTVPSCTDSAYTGKTVCCQ